MRVLLFNDNPVVTKLVTLSAQKTGDELEICSDIESIKSNEVDLLIVDDGLYNDESALGLGISITASQHLFMANRGNEKPKGFEHIINKPFLPTDLVEFFTVISNSLGSVSSENGDDEFTLDTEDMENDLDLGTLDLDEMEPDSDMLMDIDDVLEIDASEEESLKEEVQESVLDKDDLAEVQGLLEDADESLEDNISIGGLDDLGLDMDDDLLEDIEESDDILQEPSFEDDELLDTEHKQENSDELEDFTEDLDENTLESLEDEIESAVSELSDEELEESVEEDILLDIANNNESLATFSGLDDLDEQSLKIAVGEAEASDVLESAFEDDLIPQKSNSNKSTKVEGVEALKTLLKALDNDDVVNSLKGMSININISFGGDE